MSEAVKESVGVLDGITEKPSGWTEISVKVEGWTYPVELADALIEAARRPARGDDLEVQEAGVRPDQREEREAVRQSLLRGRGARRSRVRGGAVSFARGKADGMTGTRRSAATIARGRGRRRSRPSSTRSRSMRTRWLCSSACSPSRGRCTWT